MGFYSLVLNSTRLQFNSNSFTIFFWTCLSRGFSICTSGQFWLIYGSTGFTSTESSWATASYAWDGPIPPQSWLWWRLASPLLFLKCRGDPTDVQRSVCVFSTFVTSYWGSVVLMFSFSPVPVCTFWYPISFFFLLLFYHVSCQLMLGIVLSNCWWNPNFSCFCCIKIKAFKIDK